ncbi:MAG: exonuclease SbcCD subunit D [Solirubrobacterales bacterium]
MRILHTADWHLGRVLHGVNLISDQEYVLEQLIDLAAEARVDAVLIAGDIFDRSVPPAEAVALLNRVLTALWRRTGAQVMIIAGNHDSPERISFAQELLREQRLVMTGTLGKAQMPVVLHDTHGPVHFCPLPYAEPAFVRQAFGDQEALTHDLAMAGMIKAMMRQIPAEARTVAVGHAFVAGGMASESERPLTAVGGADQVDPSRFASFHYTALGHLHRPQQAGSERIRYAGSLLKYSFSESDHHKGVTLLELDQRGSLLSQEAISLKPRRDLRVLKGTLTELRRAGENDPACEDYIKAVLTDEGALFDPMGKIRSVYPNALEIERPRFAGSVDAGIPRTDCRRVSDSDLFAEFFKEVTDAPLSDSETKAVAEAFDAFYRQEREVER